MDKLFICILQSVHHNNPLLRCNVNCGRSLPEENVFAKCLLNAGMFTHPIITFCKMDWFDELFCYCVWWWFLSTSSSLEVCATTFVNRKSVLLNVCKMHALQCMGKNYTIAEDSTCKWPEHNTTGCTNCHMWETCDGRDISKLKTIHYKSICNL